MCEGPISTDTDPKEHVNINIKTDLKNYEGEVNKTSLSFYFISKIVRYSCMKCASGENRMLFILIYQQKGSEMFSRHLLLTRLVPNCMSFKRSLISSEAPCVLESTLSCPLEQLTICSVSQGQSCSLISRLLLSGVFENTSTQLSFSVSKLSKSDTVSKNDNGEDGWEV